jgi:uncharacterized membrane protein
MALRCVHPALFFCVWEVVNLTIFFLVDISNFPFGLGLWGAPF